MTVESNYVIAIATLRDWLKRLAPVYMDRPRSTSGETYQHSSDVKEHKAKITHSTYSINSILKKGFAKRTCALISK